MHGSITKMENVSSSCVKPTSGATEMDSCCRWLGPMCRRCHLTDDDWSLLLLLCPAPIVCLNTHNCYSERAAVQCRQQVDFLKRCHSAGPSRSSGLRQALPWRHSVVMMKSVRWGHRGRLLRLEGSKTIDRRPFFCNPLQPPSSRTGMWPRAGTAADSD